MAGITNYEGLKQVLDKQDTLLSKAEVNQLNGVSAEAYKSMKADIANQPVSWKGKQYKVEELVRKIDADGKIDGEPVRWGSELAAWVQVFLISHGYDVMKKDKQEGFGVDGKIGRFTLKSVSSFKGDGDRTKEVVKNKELDQIKGRLQGGREFSKARKNPINVSIINETQPWVVSVENYGQKTTVDLVKGKIIFDGISCDRSPLNRKMDLVDGKVNMASSTTNAKQLERVYRQCSLLNEVFGKIATKKVESKSPFSWKGGIEYDTGVGMFSSTSIVKLAGAQAMGLTPTFDPRPDNRVPGGKDIGNGKAFTELCNKVYAARVKQGLIK